MNDREKLLAGGVGLLVLMIGAYYIYGQVDAGLIIHEGQLTYGDQGLHLVVDLGCWWHDETGLPLPLFSTGGSSLLATLLALGLALGLAAQSEPTFDQDAFRD